MRTRFVALAAASTLVLAGCDLFAAPAGGGSDGGERPAAEGRFAHSQSDDISGVYRPDGEVGPDAATLGQVFIGQTADFEAWEAGRRAGGFAPVMLEFAGPGGRPIRVMPDSYSVSDGRVRMAGRVEGLGEVSMDARLDKGALATARRNLGDAEDPAMLATVRVGDATYTGVKLRWYGGD